MKTDYEQLEKLETELKEDGFAYVIDYDIENDWCDTYGEDKPTFLYDIVFNINTEHLTKNNLDYSKMEVLTQYEFKQKYGLIAEEYYLKNNNDLQIICYTNVLISKMRILKTKNLI